MSEQRNLNDSKTTKECIDYRRYHYDDDAELRIEKLCNNKQASNPGRYSYYGVYETAEGDVRLEDSLIGDGEREPTLRQIQAFIDRLREEVNELREER
ncbi:hypothetical protein [Haloarcula amylolytica]|uniref:hypothetical protein n=1 Tax=Haloarcula amylolytica TaxID=396317 RepID=UPI003C707FC2